MAAEHPAASLPPCLSLSIRVAAVLRFEYATGITPARFGRFGRFGRFSRYGPAVFTFAAAPLSKPILRVSC